MGKIKLELVIEVIDGMTIRTTHKIIEIQGKPSEKLKEHIWDDYRIDLDSG